MQDCLAAIARNFFPDSLGTALASSAVAELLAKVTATLKWSSADGDTDMLGLNW